MGTVSVVRKCFPVLLAQLLSKSKRESSTQFSSGVLFHFWKRSSLDHHWHVLFTQSCQPLWASQPQHWMVTRLKRSSSKDSVPKSKISKFLIYSQLYVRSLIKTNKLGPSNKSDSHRKKKKKKKKKKKGKKKKKKKSTLR